MKNPPEDATHYAEYNDYYYKPSSNKPDDFALYIELGSGEDWKKK